VLEEPIYLVLLADRDRRGVNAREVQTPRGGLWLAQTAKRALDRAG
jgi:hypothetical protein